MLEFKGRKNQHRSKAAKQKESPPTQGLPGLLSFSIQAFIWFIETHTHKGEQTQSTCLKVNLIQFIKKLEIELPYDPAIPLLGIHTKETRSERDMCTPMFIAALSIIARTWKQPRCPSANEWIRKLWYIYTMEYYTAIKKNSFESILMRWMKLEHIIQSEVSQKDKDHYNILTHIYGIQNVVNNNYICRTEKKKKKTQIYRTVFQTLWEKARVGCFKRTALKHVYYLG